MILIASVIALAVIPVAATAQPAQQEVTGLVKQIQRADYEGDRATLKHLYEALTPFVEDEALAVHVRYWRGFAMWRRAINGFNETEIDPAELEQDLMTAVEEFEAAAERDPAFIDAKIGTISSWGYLLFLNQADTVRSRELAGQVVPLLQEVQGAAPEHPRLLWVVGPIRWNVPPERGGGQDKAMEGYEKGLNILRSQESEGDDPLAPSWGEPELLMNLAWSNLNRTTPDLAAAEQQARAALELVPYWHYIRDILLPQILEAKENATDG